MGKRDLYCGVFGPEDLYCKEGVIFAVFHSVVSLLYTPESAGTSTVACVLCIASRRLLEND